MLNELITWVINTYLGKYLEVCNPAQLSVALASGEVELENVPIRKDALRSFGLPVQTLSGSIGRIKLHIPMRQFRTSPWSIVIERVYGVFGPKDLNEWDTDKEREDEYEYKKSVLDRLEADWRIDNGCHNESYYSLSYSSWTNFGASLVTNILENLELRIIDVHLRYEDTITYSTSPIAAGIRISSLSAQSCDSNWVVGAKNSNMQKVSFKLLELNGLNMYWDKLDDINMCSQLSSKDLLGRMNSICVFESHHFLTSPVNATAKFKRERCKQPLRTKTRPRISCEVLLPEINVFLTNVQYKEIVNCIAGLQSIRKICSLKICRPTFSTTNGPKSWWLYAAKCHGFTFRKSEDKWKVVKENLRYISIYKRLLTNPSENFTQEEKQFFVDVEKNRSLKSLKILRAICCDNVSAKDIRNRSVMQGRGLLYHWFPNWLGWYGVSENTSDDAQNDETYKNIEDDILSALKETIENDTFSKRDIIFGNFIFTLSSGRISLMSDRCGKNVSFLDLELQNLFCYVEVKPNLTSYKVGISLGSVSLNDKLTESTEYPYLIKPQNAGSQNHKSLYDFFNFFSRKSSISNVEPWFQLQYERSPPDKQSKCSLTIKSKSIDVVYNESAFKWLVMFFNQPLCDLKNPPQEFQHNEEKMSHLKFFKNWKNVLLGQKSKRKKWSFEIDIFAPRIIFIDNFRDVNGSVVLIDFGRFQLTNKESTSCSAQVADSQSNENESDEELFMTPCSTPPGSQTSMAGSPIPPVEILDTPINDVSASKIFINNETGLANELYSGIYDIYIINLTDFQVLVCKNRECGHACSKISSNFHLLDKFSISLQLEKRLVNTSDPEYPSVKLYGKLNKIVAHVNEQKISECLRILSPIKLDFFKQPISLESYQIATDKSNENLEFCNTTIFQFQICQIILEIQSKAKSIAEIQINGAQAGITKKYCDVIINMSVHGFLLVDAIQSFGPDFELLIASHRHFEMDGISGNLKQSEPCSPSSPGSPDPNVLYQSASPHIINRALNNLHNEIGLKSDTGNALISIDLHYILPADNSEPLQVANITFNNLDVIANQETIVELLGFGKRILDCFKMDKRKCKHEEPLAATEMDHESLFNNRLRTEISFDFHRLNILVLRSTRVDNVIFGRKVGTLTMSEAKIHASLGENISVSGALGGVQIIDVTPEGQNHQRIFSVGQDPLIDSSINCTTDVFCNLSNAMYGNDSEDDDFHYVKALSFNLSQRITSEFEIKIRMGSVWYTHCPRFIEEIYLCVKEFTEYFGNYLRVLRLTLRDDHNPFKITTYEHFMELYGFLKPLCVELIDELMPFFPNKRHKNAIQSHTIALSAPFAFLPLVAFNEVLDKTVYLLYPKHLNIVTSIRNKASYMAKELVQHVGTKNIPRSCSQLTAFSLDIAVSSPVLVLPRSCQSKEVLVANLGKITICNSQEHLPEEALKSVDLLGAFERVTYFIDIRDINLFSLNISERIVGSAVIPKAEEIYSCEREADPILHNTALLFQCTYESKTASKESVLEKQQTLLIDGSVTQKLHICLSRSQYEQLMDSLTYASKILLFDETCSQGNSEDLPMLDNLTVQSKSTSSIVKTRIQFSVPLLKLDLHNEHKRSLVHLSFEEFSMKKILTSERTDVEIFLRSVLMEDLKCDVASKLRNMVNSSNNFDQLSHFIGQKMSTSCPDITKLETCYITSTFGSVPSNLQKVDRNVSCSDRRSFNIPKSETKHSKNANALSENLVIYRSATEKLPLDHEMPICTSSIDFNCLNLIISTEKWFMVLDFFGLLSNQTDTEEELLQDPKLKDNAIVQELNISIRSLNLLLVRDESELAKANISSFKLHLKKNKLLQSVEGRLGSLSVYDMTPFGSLYQEKFSTTGTEALCFAYKRLQDDHTNTVQTAQRRLENDSLLLIRMSSVRYVHTKRFLVDLQMFVNELLQLQSPVLSRIKYNKNSSKRRENKPSLKIGLDIHAESPIILLPVTYNSNHLLIADLGKMSLENSFHFANDIESQDKEETFNQIIDLIKINLININLMMGERETKREHESIGNVNNKINVGNCCIITLGESILKERCHLNIEVLRTTEVDETHVIPDIRVKGTFSELNGLLNVQQYKMIRGLLDFNLGETIDDVYYKYRINLNESLERLCSVTKIDSSQSNLSVWKTMSINFILDNVTICLAEPDGNTNCGSKKSNSNLACIKFIKSTLEIDFFSDGSQDIDLISTEILIIDARTKNEENCGKNCFKYILKPSMDTTADVQAEIHSRRRKGFAKHTILLNNMRIMALLDYLEKLKNFLNEEPLMSSSLKNVKPSNAAPHIQNRHATKNNSIEDNVLFEFVLNITNSEVVFVENCEHLDTSAVILKSTTVFSYKPTSEVAPISVDINHLEIFSCTLGSESASSLSIIDPFSLNMELRNQCLSVVIPNQVFLRFSYNDALLFSRMLRSIPYQTKNNNTTVNHTEVFDLIAPLTAMGFKQNECWTAMQICNNNLNDAALWLTNKKSQTPNSVMNINNLAVNINSIYVCIIDDCLDADVPLLELSFASLMIDQKLNKTDNCVSTKNVEGTIEAIISCNYYNRRLSGWEPVIEGWECQSRLKYSWNFLDNSRGLRVEINSKQILKLNITSTLIELCQLVRNNWTKDYFVRSEESINTNTNVRQRLPFLPFALKNLTGEPLLFKIFYSQAGGITRTEVTKQDLMCNWISANPEEIVPFDFGPQIKLRHLDSHKLNMHQILVQIHGWTLIGPISIDKVGTFFRYASFDMQYFKKTRIVFEIELVGSAQKLITVRSAVNVFNSTRHVFFLHMKPRNESEKDIVSVKSAEKFTIPLRHIDSLIFLMPQFENSADADKDSRGMNLPYTAHTSDEIENMSTVCTKPITWLNCVSQDIFFETHFCFSSNKYPFFVLSEIKKDNFPSRDVGPIPGHTITILPPLRIKNLLSCDLLYKINDHTHGRISASNEIENFSLNLKESFSLSITLDNYKLSGHLKIPVGHSGVVEPKLKLIDILNRELYLNVSIQSVQGRGMEITIGVPMWIVNKTGLPLVFRQEGTNRPASGQFEEHEFAREVSPLMFSFSDYEGAPLLEFRLGNSFGANNPWSKCVGLQKDTTFRELKSEKSNINYFVGVSVYRGKGIYCATTFVILSPRFQLHNRSSKMLQFAQKFEVQHKISPELVITSPPGSNFPFHWANSDQELLLCVRIADGEYCHWSSGLPVNEAKSLYINLRIHPGEMYFLRLEVIVQGGTNLLHFTDAYTLPPPIRFDNFSDVAISFSQKGIEPFWRTIVKPKSSLAYVLDDPLGTQVIRVEAPGGNTIEYPIRNKNEAKNITYANFIYIAFKETFRDGVSEDHTERYDFKTQQLVLGVKDKQVIITKKCSGDRSQLWLMNSYGQLEHEGSSPPTEYLKSIQDRPRLVLDLERPPNPTEYTKLVIRPQNNQRMATQTWRFENGRLMCHANMCVQAPNGIYGLNSGCDAVLGRTESSDKTNGDVPVEQNLEIQKLRPGSGHLEVLSKMDGPIRSIQILDVKSNSENISLSPDSKWRHASTFKKSLTETIEGKGSNEVLIKVVLPKGLGISVVTRSPCEELLYITFENISLEFTQLSISTSLDFKVADIQIDNQLLDALCPIMFYSSKVSTSDLCKDALTLRAKLLPSPNEHAVIFEYLVANLRPFSLLLDERVILKTALFLGYGIIVKDLKQQIEYHTLLTDDIIFSKKSKRFYFENLSFGSTQVRLTVLTAPKLKNELLGVKKLLGLTLINLEDAVVEFERFTNRHHFETLDVYAKGIKNHYVNQLKWHAASILGSVDFLGNPLGFANDLSEGVSGLIFEGSVKSLVKNVTHGISNSTAKLTETISDSLGRVVLDEHDNETRRKILQVNYPTTSSHLTAGLKGLGFGLLGGVTSIVRHTYAGAQTDGFPGFLSGFGKGVIGTVTKPLIGVLDLASETASAVRETSRGTHRILPDRKRLPRCVTGAPGGLLPNFSYRQSKGQQYLYVINKRNWDEKLIFYEPNLCNDKDSKLRLLVSTEFVRIFSRCDDDPSVMIECHLSEVLSCHPVTTTTSNINPSKIEASFYIEISTNLPKVTRPRIRCQNEEIAERASRCINYAKSIFDEREHTLINN